MPGPPRADRARRGIAALAAVVLLALSSAHAARPTGPWIAIEARPAAVPLLAGERSDGSVRLSFRNLLERPVRIHSVSFAWLAGEKPLRRDTPGEAFFRTDWLERSARLEPGRVLDWPGVCLENPPPRADRVRLSFTLVTRSGLSSRETTQWVDLPLVPLPAPVRLELPFAGLWRVTQGHGCRTNHRIGGHGGEYAWDFAALDRRGRPSSGAEAMSRRNEEIAGFALPVLAPAAGRVVRVVNGLPDNVGLTDYPRRSLTEERERPDVALGNYVVLDIGGGAYALLGHLQQGSISVAVGATVAAGEVVGRCGNSGNSILPHLHLQVMDRPDPTDPAVAGLPATLLDYIELRVVGDGDGREVVATDVEEGNPPEDVIVGPQVRIPEAP